MKDAKWGVMLHYTTAMLASKNLLDADSINLNKWNDLELVDFELYNMNADIDESTYFSFKQGSPAPGLGIEPIDLSSAGSTLAK